MEDSLILIIYNEIYFLNIEFISENLYKKKLYINGKNIDLKEREVDVFYLLVSNFNDIVSKETIIRSLLNKKSLEQELLDIDIKYSNNRVSEVIGKIERLLCDISKKNYIKNLFIQRKSKLGYSLSSDSDFFNDKIIIKKIINLNTNNEIDNFYNEYKNHLFIQNSKYFNSHYNKNTKKEYLEESPNIDFFYGREEEINDIKTKLEKNNLICIYGSGGIGKSYIAKKLVDKIKYDYDIILWKNLRNIHSLESFIEELIYKTSEKKEIIQNNNTEENINNLIEKIKHKKILIILDNYENLLENKNISISYKEKFKDYHTLIEKISSSQETSKSRIIITSREKPKELRENKDKNFNLKVEWLDYESCNKIILRNGIFSDKTTINKFIYKLGGNPQLINMLSHTIKKVFLGNLTHFFNINSNLTFDIYNFLDEQFNKISQIEQDIMFNITISRKNIDFNYLFDKLSYVSKIDIINYVEILIDRAFISVNDNILSIQNIISEYFNKKLNILVSEEIINNKPNILKKLFLISNIEDIETIESQKTYFVSEIIKLLLESLNNLDVLKLKINDLILLRENLSIEEQQILNSNIINIIIESGLDLKDFNFENTYLKNLYLKGISLKDVSFYGCNFEKDVIFNELGKTSSYDLLSNEMIVIFNIKNDIYKYNIENKTLDKILDLNTEETIKILKVSKDDKLLSFITNDKYLFVYNLLDKKYIFKSKIINLDSSKIFFSSENENIVIYSYEGIEIYNIKNNTLVNYIQDDTLKLCYDLKLLDSIETLIIIKNDFNVYFYKYKNSIIELTKTNISNTLFIEYNEIEDIFITINLNKEILLYNSNFDIISKSSSIINKNEEIKDFFINQSLNKLLIFGSKIWIFDYSSLDLINTIDTNIKNLQSSVFYNNKNYLCLCYHDFRIDIFDLNKGKKINIIKGLNEVSNSIEKNLNYLYLYLFGSENISIYSLKDKKVKNIIITDYSTITASSNKKNTLIALYNMEKNITLFDINKNKMIKKIEIKDNNTFCLDLNEDASILAYKDGCYLIFLDTIDYKILNKIKTNNNYYSKAFKFSTCCNKFVCLDTDSSILITNISNFRVNKIDVKHKIIDFIYINDNIYSISNNEFFITNINNSKSNKYLTFDNKLIGLSYSYDLKNIFLCTKDKIYVFDISTNIIITTIEIEEYLYAIQGENEILFGITLSGYIYYFNIKNGSFIEKYKISHPYENLNIQETTGLSKVKKDIINSLGAII